MSTVHAFRATLKRDLLIALKRRNDLLNPFMFFIIVASLFPLAVSPDPDQLRVIAPGILWVSALLASMLSMDSLYRADFEDGSLEQLLLSPHPLYFLVLAKNIAHWLVSGLPIVLISPMLAVMLNLTPESYFALITTLLLGTPILSLLGSIGVALTVGLGSRGLILAIIILPMSVPILVLGALAVQNDITNVPLSFYLSWLGVGFLVALALAPLASAAGLRISVN